MLPPVVNRYRGGPKCILKGQRQHSLPFLKYTVIEIYGHGKGHSAAPPVKSPSRILGLKGRSATVTAQDAPEVDVEDSGIAVSAEAWRPDLAP
jgi:hypothetical protein